MLKNEHKIANEVICVDSKGIENLTYMKSYLVDKYATLDAHRGAKPGYIFVFNDNRASYRYKAERFQVKTLETDLEESVLHAMPHLLTHNL